MFQFVQRRNKSDRPATLFLLKGRPWVAISSSTRNVVSTLAPSSPIETYTFAKHIVEVVSCLVQQLCFVWGANEANVSGETSESCGELLTLLLELLQHPSLLISGHALAGWSQVFNNAVARKHPVVLGFLDRWMNAAVLKVPSCCL
jgi:hypothetical protein